MAYTPEQEAILKKLGKNIRTLRKARGWSQEECAYRCELDRAYFGSIERGERNVAILNLHKIAATLEVAVERLGEELLG